MNSDLEESQGNNLSIRKTIRDFSNPSKFSKVLHTLPLRLKEYPNKQHSALCGFHTILLDVQNNIGSKCSAVYVPNCSFFLSRFISKQAKNAISEAQNCKRGHLLGFAKLQLIAKFEKIEGDPCEDIKY